MELLQSKMFYPSYFWSKFLITLFCNSVLIIVICMLLWGNQSIDYSIIIKNETQLWSTGALIDVVSVPAQPIPQQTTLYRIYNTDPEYAEQSEKCPTGYTILMGVFYGTYDICYDYNTNHYNIGGCEPTSADQLVQIYGITPSTIQRINGTYFCFKRASQNYHDIVKQREIMIDQMNNNNETNNTIQLGQNGSQVPQNSQSLMNLTNFQHICGSPSDINKQYPAFDNGKCFTNNLQFVKTSDLNRIKKNGPVSQYTQYDQTWSQEHIFNDIQNNPIVDLYFGLSQPCININTDFMNRTNPIPLLYRNQNNDCDMYYTIFNYEYISTGLEITELDAYTDNEVLNLIKSIVPNYHSTDLQQNYYEVFQKTYALWKSECQRKLNTEEFAQAAENLIYNEAKQSLILDITSYFIALEYLITVIVLNVDKQLDRKLTKYFNIGVIFCFFLTTVLLVTIIYSYGRLFGTLYFQSLDIINQANQYNCSEGNLAEAIKLYQQESANDQVLIKVGYSAAGVILISNFLAFFFLSEVPQLICSIRLCQIPCGSCFKRRKVNQNDSIDESNRSKQQKVNITQLSYNRTESIGQSHFLSSVPPTLVTYQAEDQLIRNRDVHSGYQIQSDRDLQHLNHLNGNIDAIESDRLAVEQVRHIKPIRIV